MDSPSNWEFPNKKLKWVATQVVAMAIGTAIAFVAVVCVVWAIAWIFGLLK
jgi:hypothetical protein